MQCYLDSGVGAARAGNLTFMVGGVEQEFNAAKELLTCMGSNVVYCGEVGTGQVMLSEGLIASSVFPFSGFLFIDAYSLIPELNSWQYIFIFVCLPLILCL